MKIYRITRYDNHGHKMWQRLKPTKHTFGAAKGDINSYIGSRYHGASQDRVTLEVADIPDDAFKLVEEYQRPND